MAHFSVPERDTTRPDLFYHLVSSSAPSPVFALSFLEKPLNPDRPDSRTVVGWVGKAEGDAVADDAFQENPTFRGLLHEAIQSALSPPELDKTVEAEAIRRGEGWLHINDLRNIPALGRIGDPDDIIGTVMVRDGKVMPETYQAMPSYRVCTADGPTKLPEGLASRLKELLEKEWEMERQASEGSN